MPNQSQSGLSLTKSDLFNCIQLIKEVGFNSAPIRRSGVSQCTPAFLTIPSAGQQCTSEKRKAEDAVEGPKMQGYWKERILFRVSCLERCVTENIRNVCRNASKCRVRKSLRSCLAAHIVAGACPWRSIIIWSCIVAGSMGRRELL